MGYGALQHKKLAAMNNNEIFLDFWRSYQWPEKKSVSQRLYHDDDGYPLFYTMEDLPGKYVEVTPEQYARASFKVKVIDGQVRIIESNKIVRKLQPGDQGTPCHPKDITIVVGKQEAYLCWNKK